MAKKTQAPVYAAHTELRPTSEVPLRPASTLRNIWGPLFREEECFLRSEDLVRIWRVDKVWDPPCQPYIPGFGSVVFHAKRTTFSTNSWEDYPEEVARALLHLGSPFEGDMFGYLPNVSDQRFNFLFFEARRSLPLFSVQPTGFQADGHIHVNLFPQGLCALHAPITIRWEAPVTLEESVQLLLDTRPHTWTDLRWDSRLGSGTLREHLDDAWDRIQHALFDSRRTLPDGVGFASYRLPHHGEAAISSARDLLHGSETEVRHMRFTEQAKVIYTEEGFGIAQNSTMRTSLLSSPRGFVLLTHPARSRRSRLRLFWKIQRIATFVLAQKIVYRQYRDFFRHEIEELRRLRLSGGIKKVIEEDPTRLSVYAPGIRDHIGAIDLVPRTLKPLFRRVYAELSESWELDAERRKTRDLLDEWEGEVARWEPPIMTLWKTILSPLRKAFME